MSRLVLIVGGLLVGCAAQAPPTANAATTTVPAATTAVAPVTPVAAVTAPADGSLRVNVHGGAEVLKVEKASDGTTTLTFTVDGQTTSLLGTSKDGLKRKYTAGQAVLFETKWDDDGFKLKTPDGKLLYKVKLKDDKIKVSDNEESANPFELKAREGDRIKVVAPGDKEIGNVRANVVEDGGGKKVFDAAGRAGSAAYGVMLLNGIPPAQRFVIVSELFMRGK